MSGEDEQLKAARLLGELHGKMDQFFERYDNDRKETTGRYQQEREERKQWRDGIESKVDGLEKKMDPVIKDHEMIVRGSRWLVASVVGIYGTLKGWIFLKEHLK